MTPLSHTSTPPQVYSSIYASTPSDPPKECSTPTRSGGPRPRPARRPLPQPQPQPPSRSGFQSPTLRSCVASSISPTSTFSPLARQATAPTPVPPSRSSSATPPLQEMPSWPSKSHHSVFASRVSTRSHSTPAPTSPLNISTKLSPLPEAAARSSTPNDSPGFSPRQMGPRHRRTDSGHRRPLPSLPPPAPEATAFSPPPNPAPPTPPTPSMTSSPAPTVTVVSPPPMATTEPSETKSESPSKSATAPTIPTFSIAGPDEQNSAPAIPSISAGLDDHNDDESSKPAPPTIPLISFDGPDQEEVSTTTTTPLVPTISFGSDEEVEVPHAAPPVPSISIGSDEEDEGQQGVSIHVPTLRGKDTATSTPSHSHDHLYPNGPEPGSVPSQRAVSGPLPLGGGFCGGCSQILTGGKVIRALNKLWHPKCFRCDHCSTRLEHISFYVHENHAYCHVDYHELFSKRCFHCQTPIVDARFIAIDDPRLAGDKLRYYHDLHFFCAHCGDPFVDPSRSASAPGQGELEDKEDEPVAGSRPFFTVKGYPYCERCHVQLHAPKCHACRKPIQGANLNALGKNWHPDCFVCAGCQGAFEGSRFFEHGGQAYDEDCYANILKSLR